MGDDKDIATTDEIRAVDPEEGDGTIEEGADAPETPEYADPLEEED